MYGTAVASVTVLSTVIGAVAQENWPTWRGPERDGVSGASGLPVSWSETENLLWKIPLPCWAGSSPIVWGDRLFLTTPNRRPEDQEPAIGRRLGRAGRSDPGGPDIELYCYAAKDGSLVWKKTVASGNKLYGKQNMASPSPVTDGTHVWVVTGTGVVACYDFEGARRWTRDVQKDYGSFGLNWGYASSPLLHEGMLIVEVLHGMTTDEPSYLLALSAASGETLWKVDRPSDAVAESPDAYTTPASLKRGTRTEIVVSGADYVTGHDSENGKELWRVAGLNPDKARNYRVVGSPIVVEGFVYASSRRKPLLAIRIPEAHTDAQPEVAWTTDLGPDVPTPVCDGKLLFIVDDRGVAVCLDAKTGVNVWGPERLARGTYSASPVLADGKLYATSETGTTTVLAAGAEFKVLATNQLDDPYVLSSPAVCDGRIYIRGAEHLYCIGGPASISK